MLRWAIFFLGIALLGFGAYLHFDARWAEALVLEVDTRGALEVLDEGGDRFLRLDADIDTDERIWVTGLRRPGFCACAPTDLRVLACVERPDCFRSDVGCAVAARCLLAPDILSLRADDAGEVSVLEARRLLAPVTGTRLCLWVLSPPFAIADDEAMSRWTRRERFVGQLSSFGDLTLNVPEIAHEIDDIRETYREEFGRVVPDDACVLLAEAVAHSVGNEGRSLVPVTGSGDALFVQLHGESLPGPGERIAGILHVLPRELLGGLAEVLGRELPPRVGIVERISTAEITQRSVSRARAWIAVGVACISFVVLISIIGARRFRAERRAATAMIEDAMAREQIRREAALEAQRARERRV